jgi:hypothetical protein
MKYVLVDRGANIIDRVDLDSEVGLTGAKTFFIGRKQIDEKEFDNLWKVMTEEAYDIQHKASLQNRQSAWWKEDKTIIDEELKY